MKKSVLPKTIFQTAFRSTLIFLMVRLIQVISGVVRNKFGAVFLGPFGIGLFGIYMNSINLIQKISSLGISEVAMRDISEIKEHKSEKDTQNIMSIVKILSKYTGLLGLIIMILFSPILSKLNFGSYDYTLEFILISIIIFFNILNEGNLSILKGLRKIKYLAYANSVVSFIGAILVIPFYFYLGVAGIIPLLIIISISSYLVGNFYLNKFFKKNRKVNLKDFKQIIFSMIKIGLAVVSVSFLGFLFEMLVISYLTINSGTDTVGYYFAGYSIVITYFGLIINSIVVDFYPRISSKLNNINYLTSELNEQTRIGLILILPLSILLCYLSQDIVKVLFNSEFILASKFIDFAILGSIFMVVSNNSGMVIIAKKMSKIYTYISIIHRLLLLIIYYFLYQTYGFIGLGLGYLFNGLLQFIFYELILFKYLSIRHSKQNYLLLFIVLISSIFMLILKSNFSFIHGHSDLIFLIYFIISSAYSLKFINDKNGFDFLIKKRQ